ncbi:MAG: hypothetical protein ACXW1D_00540 [Halobacteriota archaeon]
MGNTFVAADLHLSHRGIVKFLKDDGTKVRPWDNTQDMDEAIIQNWNNTVKQDDKVYVLGDVVINRSALPLLGRLNGAKILIKGNHDVFRLNEFTPYFKDIRGSHTFGEFLLTHIPVHPREIAPTGRWKGNIHGHLHTDVVTKTVYDNSWYGQTQVVDPRYLCVSMEQINYTPISWDDVKVKWEAQQ